MTMMMPVPAIRTVVGLFDPWNTDGTSDVRSGSPDARMDQSGYARMDWRTRVGRARRTVQMDRIARQTSEVCQAVRARVRARGWIEVDMRMDYASVGYPDMPDRMDTYARIPGSARMDTGCVRMQTIRISARIQTISRARSQFGCARRRAGGYVRRNMRAGLRADSETVTPVRQQHSSSSNKYSKFAQNTIAAIQQIYGNASPLQQQLSSVIGRTAVGRSVRPVPVDTSDRTAPVDPSDTSVPDTPEYGPERARMECAVRAHADR